jgi:hypothetical protein
MKKRYFYEFKGNVYLEADNQDEAEELVMGISLVDYLIDEDSFLGSIFGLRTLFLNQKTML